MTQYELIATDPAGKVWLAGYVRIPSRDAMLRMMRQHGKAWASLTGCENVIFEGKGRMNWRARIGAWEVRFSGRTKLEAEPSQHPFILETIP